MKPNCASWCVSASVWVCLYLCMHAHLFTSFGSLAFYALLLTLWLCGLFICSASLAFGPIFCGCVTLYLSLPLAYRSMCTHTQNIARLRVSVCRGCIFLHTTRCCFFYSFIRYFCLASMFMFVSCTHSFWFYWVNLDFERIPLGRCFFFWQFTTECNRRRPVYKCIYLLQHIVCYRLFCCASFSLFRWSSLPRTDSSAVLAVGFSSVRTVIKMKHRPTK